MRPNQIMLRFSTVFAGVFSAALCLGFMASADAANAGAKKATDYSK